MPNSVDNNTYTSENILSGDNILMYVGPASLVGIAGATTALALPGEEEPAVNAFKLVGLVQGFNTSTTRPQRQVPELGSKSKYLVSSRGQKQMSIGRLMTDKGNVLNALYRGLTNDNTTLERPSMKIWLSVDHPLFRKPFGMIIRVINYSVDPDGSEKQRTFFGDVTIASIGTQVTEGDRGIAENVTMLWASTEDLFIANGSST